MGSNPIEDACLARYVIWQSGECDHRSGGDRPSCSVGSTPTRATAITSIARATSACRIFVIANENASAGHWRAQVAVTHPPSGIGVSTPSRRTSSRPARSSRSLSWSSAAEAAIEPLDFSESRERMRGVGREVGCEREDVAGVAAGSGVVVAAFAAGRVAGRA